MASILDKLEEVIQAPSAFWARVSSPGVVSFLFANTSMLCSPLQWYLFPHFSFPEPLTFLSLCQWFFGDSAGIEHFVEDFAKKNKDVFDLEAEEHKLEYTKVYQDFQDKFEKKIEVVSIWISSVWMQVFSKYKREVDFLLSCWEHACIIWEVECNQAFEANMPLASHL